MPKRPRDANQLAKLITELATGQASGARPAPAQEGKDPAAVSLGRRGGLKGGRARADKLTPRAKAAGPGRRNYRQLSDRQLLA
jgi:hypothetical protein